MINALVCIPYLELKEPYESCIRQYADSDIRFEVRHIIGIKEALEDAVEDFDIVVARGITAATVARKWPNKHLIEIELSMQRPSDAMKRCFPISRESILP